MKHVTLFLLLLLVSSSVLGMSLQLSFGEGVTHNVQALEATTGAPSVGTNYCFTSSGVSTSSGNAFTVSDVTESGQIKYAEYLKTGDCDWTVYVNSTAVPLASFDGYVVSDGDKIKWCTSPNSETVVACTISMDYNVVVV